ncbi:MAG: AraC family transcriptional regulator [Alphaproteobacteria bacterium]|nr:AraC family transcriptional regulator [Alphaproteobacteria bacterium]
MDVLSEVLRVVRLAGAIHFRGEFTRPWAFSTTPPALLAARLKVPEGSVTPFHVFIEGSCWITVGAFPPIRIETGDVVIFPRADQHVMASDLGLEPLPINRIYAQPSREQITMLRHGGPGAAARFICGFLHADQRFDPLLRSLPALLWVRERDGVLALETLGEAGREVQPIPRRAEAEWWRASLRYLVAESAVPGPGNRAALARLAETLFVEVLRWRLRQAAAGGHGGWLAGLHDPQVGRALGLLHALPHRPWTLEALAKEARMSRAAFAQRFADMVGEAPIRYLALWRMQLAQHLLRDSTLPVAAVAERVGYESEAAFSRAFRRFAGTPPAAWRRERQSSACADEPMPKAVPEAAMPGWEGMRESADDSRKRAPSRA